MSEPIGCRCPRCLCPQGTRNPDGLCRRCADGACVGLPREPEWVHRAHEHHLPVKVIQR